MIETNKLYRGQDGARRIVLSVDGDVVTYQLPISGILETASLADFEAWAAES